MSHPRVRQLKGRWPGSALLIPLLICGMGKPLHAADSPPAEETRLEVHERVVELVTQSAAHYEAGRFRLAVDLLEQAFELEGAATIQYNLARAYEGLGDTRRAIDAYRLYLNLAPDAPDRRAVELRLGVLERQQEEREALRKRAAEAESSRPAQELASEPGPGWVPWGVSALGVVVVGVGVVFGVRATGLHGDAERAEYAADAEDANRSARTYATLANVAFLAGGALALGGVTWGVLTLPRDDTGRAALGSSRRPLRSSDGVGLSVSGTF